MGGSLGDFAERPARLRFYTLDDIDGALDDNELRGSCCTRWSLAAALENGSLESLAHVSASPTVAVQGRRPAGARLRGGDDEEGD